MHHKLINKVIASNDINKLKQLAELEIDTIDILKDYSKSEYESIENDLYEIIEGKKLNREMADEWVASMTPKAKWTYEQVEQTVNKYNLNIPYIDAYVLFNMLYSDMQNALGTGDTEDSINRYINATKGWYFDNDLKINGSEKLYNYYKYIVKR